LRPCGGDRQGDEERQFNNRREPARPDRQVIHDSDLKADDDKDSTARKPKINGPVCQMSVRL